MILARRVAAALAIAGAGVLAYAVPVSATGQHATHECVDGTHRDDLNGHIDTSSGVGTVTGKAALCAPVDILFSIYKVPDTWDGDAFNGTAVPQHVLQTVRGTLQGEETLSLQVGLPACGNVQADLYYPPEIPDIDINGTGPGLIAGYIWQISPPTECKPATTTPSATETTPSATETTASETTASVAETTASPTETETPTGNPTETTPSATPTTTPATTPATTTTIAPPPPIGRPIPLPPVGPPPPPQQLPMTGSNSTIPLVGLGLVLLGSGIALSLIGRRRRTA